MNRKKINIYSYINIKTVYIPPERRAERERRRGVRGRTRPGRASDDDLGLGRMDGGRPAAAYLILRDDDTPPPGGSRGPQTHGRRRRYSGDAATRRRRPREETGLFLIGSVGVVSRVRARVRVRPCVWSVCVCACVLVRASCVACACVRACLPAGRNRSPIRVRARAPGYTNSARAFVCARARFCELIADATTATTTTWTGRVGRYTRSAAYIRLFLFYRFSRSGLCFFHPLFLSLHSAQDYNIYNNIRIFFFTRGMYTTGFMYVYIRLTIKNMRYVSAVQMTNSK